MRQDIRDRLKKIPQFAHNVVYEECADDAMAKIVNVYIKDDDAKLESVKNIIGLALLKDIKIEDLSERMESELKIEKRKAKEIALIVLCEIFYTAKEYFPGIDDEILKLGGEIPKKRPALYSKQILEHKEEDEKIKNDKEKEDDKKQDVIVKKPIEELIKEYPKAGDQIIGSQDSINVKGMPIPMKPMIKYWLRDYKEKMEYGWQSNLDRIQYIYHDKNTKNMNEEERRQLNIIFKSFDEKIALPYSVKKGKIYFSEK